MKRPPIKMLLATRMSACGISVLLCLCLMTAHTNAAPSPQPEPDPALYAASAMPSIYSYTITNQNKQQKQQQQQQLQQQLEQEQLLSNDFSYSSTINNKNNNNNNNYNYNSAKNNNYNNKNNNNNNLINYSTNSQNYRSGNTNRNFYYTNTATSNSNSNFRDTHTASSPMVSSASSTASSSSAFSSSPAPAAPASGCNLDRLAVYKVVLHTYWTRDLFPKHYPDWRPTAQWTKTIGRTHDPGYALYHIGQQATPGVKQFAETGKFDILDSIAAQQQQQQLQKPGNSFTSFVSTSSGSQAKSMQESAMQQQQQPLLQHGERSVFDEFSIPAITTGAGRSEAKFFVDSNHSLVSLMTRIVPSPDWFIGVDSFQLCVGGSWIDTVTVEMDPLDAGTDNGFTFTAPNWPTSPQGVIYRITSRYPAHPAGSFFYPKSKRLPPIATFQLIKLKEYDLSEVFNFAEDDRKYETVQTQTHLETEHNHVEMNNELSASIERERQSEVTALPASETERDRIRSQLLAKMNPMSNSTSNAAQYAMNFNAVPKNDKHALMQNIAQSYRRRGGIGSTQTSEGAGGTAKRRRTKRQRDCRVSHWSDWSACSKTCGIGEMHRYRKVIKHGKRGGRPCPALQESKWCGSEKGCHKPTSYFNWSIT